MSNIEDASRVTAGSRSLAIVEELWRSACVESVMGQLLQKCWEQFESRCFWHWLHCRVARKIVDHILKQCVQKGIKNHANNYPKSKKIKVWRVLWEVWEPAWSHVDQGWLQKRENARQMLPKLSNLVPIWGSSWSQNPLKNLWFLCFFLELSWKRNWHRNHSKMELGSESGESVILNNTTTF